MRKTVEKAFSTLHILCGSFVTHCVVLVKSVVEVSVMIIRNKGCYILAAAVCMAAVSTPTHAWRGFGKVWRVGQLGWWLWYCNYCSRRFGQLVAVPVTLMTLMVDRQPGATLLMAMVMATVPRYIMAVAIAAVMLLRRRVSPVWRSVQWQAPQQQPGRLPLLLLSWYNSRRGQRRWRLAQA
jgi:hypothetical protein